MCGLASSIFTLLAPMPSRGDSEVCVEPWLERCLFSTNGCVDCNRWCKMVVGETCVKRYHFCAKDEELCGTEMPIYEECSCKVGSEPEV